jgi:uroporphyrinogen-III synthase
MKALSTKVLSAEQVKYAASLGIQLDCIDLIETRILEFDAEGLKENADSLVFTSANGVSGFYRIEEARKYTNGKLVFSISGKTKSSLNDLGINVDASAENASLLGDIIVANNKVKSVLHVCGNLRLDVLEKKMKAAGKTYRTLVVYETLPNKYSVKKGPYDAVLFYSPSAIEAFCNSSKPEKNVLYCCIGDTTADALRKKNAVLNIITPQTPSPEAMIESLATYFKIIGKK